MDSPLNPNFWKCACGIRNALLEPYCDICHVIQEDGQPATQQEVNIHADFVAAQQKKAREKKRELPQPRKKPVPTREEFEKALDWLEKDNASIAEWKAKGCYTHPMQQPYPRAHYEMIVKRYKALA